jgi:hypothetical protein
VGTGRPVALGWHRSTRARVRVRPAGELVGLPHLIAVFVAGPRSGAAGHVLPRRSQYRQL